MLQIAEGVAYLCFGPYVQDIPRLLLPKVHTPIEF